MQSAKRGITLNNSNILLNTMTVDLISDMITRLRNASIINKKLISLPFNKNNYIIIKILEREGYIFCSTFINNRDKLFVKLLELIFIKKKFSYNDSRVKNLLFFIRNLVKTHQSPEQIKKSSKSEKTLSILNTIDNNLTKEKNFDLKDLANPISSIISKFRNSYKKKKDKSKTSSGQQSFSKKKTLKNQKLQIPNPKIAKIYLLASTPLSSIDLKVYRRKLAFASRNNKLKKRLPWLANKNLSSQREKLVSHRDLLKSQRLSKKKKSLKKKNSLIGNDVFNNMDANFYINHLLASTLESKKNLENISSNLNMIKVNSKSDDVNSNLARFSSTARKINKTLDYMHFNLSKINQSYSGPLPIIRTEDREKHENNPETIISTLTDFQKTLDKILSVIPMPGSMVEKNKNININDLEFSITKFNKYKNKIKSFLFKLSKYTDNLQFNIKRSCKQVAKLKFSLRINKYSSEFNTIASKQQKNLKDLKSKFRYELNKSLENIIFYFNMVIKTLDNITSTFNIKQLKKVLAIEPMQPLNFNRENFFSAKHGKHGKDGKDTIDNSEIKSYITHLPSIKVKLKKHLDFVKSKFIELKKNFHVKFKSNSFNFLGKKKKKRKKKQFKTIFADINATITHLSSNDTLEFSNKIKINKINSYIFILLNAIFKLKKNPLVGKHLLNDIKSNLNDSSLFSSKKLDDKKSLKNTKKNVNLTDSNAVDKPVKVSKKKKLKKRLKPEEKLTYYYDPIKKKTTFLPLKKDSDSSNDPPPISTTIEKKKEPQKPLKLEKYLRNKNNNTFQTLFNPNFSKIILLALNLNAKEKSSIHGIRRISKPSLRCYSRNPIPRSFGGLGVFIVSTNCGIMTDNEAREKNLGGEIMLEIW